MNYLDQKLLKEKLQLFLVVILNLEPLKCVY